MWTFFCFPRGGNSSSPSLPPAGKVQGHLASSPGPTPQFPGSHEQHLLLTLRTVFVYLFNLSFRKESKKKKRPLAQGPSYKITQSCSAEQLSTVDQQSRAIHPGATTVSGPHTGLQFCVNKIYPTPSPPHWVQFPVERYSILFPFLPSTWPSSGHTAKRNTKQKPTFMEHLKSSEVRVAQSGLTLCNPVDYTLLGILQARILVWVAYPSPGDLPDPGVKPRSPAMQADSAAAEPQFVTRQAGVNCFERIMRYG